MRADDYRQITFRLVISRRLADGRLVRRAIYTRQSVSAGDGLSSCQVQFEACES